MGSFPRIPGTAFLRTRVTAEQCLASQGARLGSMLRYNGTLAALLIRKTRRVTRRPSLMQLLTAEAPTERWLASNVHRPVGVILAFSSVGCEQR
jgi:hypothetical protein